MRQNQLPKLFLPIPAQAHFTATGVYIDYYTPTADGKRKRHIIRCNRLVKPLRNRYEKRQYLNRLCSVINCQLFDNNLSAVPDQLARPDVKCNGITIADACRRFIDDKSKYLRPDTMRTYKSLANRFLTQCNDTDKPVADFDKSCAIDFLDKIVGVNNRSYNNYLKQCRAMFAWFVERSYILANPFADLKPRRTTQKTRTLIPASDRKRILDYCDRHLPYLSLVLQLVYSSLIRPKEIRHIRVSYIDFESHQIWIPPEVAKNRHGRYATFTPQIQDRLQRIVQKNTPDQFYLIGVNNRPSAKIVADKRFLKDWYIVKSALHLPDNYQLYSFRDTGITDLIKTGIDEISVMQHADHSDLKITSIYARHKDKRLSDVIWSKAPMF